MLPKADLLKGVQDPDSLTRVLDRAEQALRTWQVVFTDFLSPPVLVEAQQVLARLSDLQGLAWGGYSQAERQRLALARADLPLEAAQIEVTALNVAGNFLFDPASHRDYLGAILGTGIVRDKVGDILVLGDRGAQVLVTPEITEFLLVALTQVRTVPVRVEIMPLTDLRVRPLRLKEMTTVEASLRLDAIASAGFGLSRSKMVTLINDGNVQVNWQPKTQSSYTLQAGDLITVRGKGRIEIGEISITKKQRYRIHLRRYS